MAIDRRNFMTMGSAVVGATVGATGPFGSTPAHARTATPQTGALDASHFGVRPGAAADQRELLQQAIDEAARRGMPLFLHPGRYLLSEIVLPSGTYLSGVPGYTQLLFAGGSHMFYARGAANVTLTGLSIAGAGNGFTSGTPGLVYLRSVSNLNIEGCSVTGSARSGIVLEYAAGRIANCELSDAGDAALLSLDAKGLEVTGNVVRACHNNGIQIWRAKPGDDGTIVTQNRIFDIRARDGGSGQNGNGINLFRAGAVIVSNNRISDCAFSAIRSNASSNCQIVSNSCARLGEVALYAEFGFEGAVISSNLVDQAATGISITNFDHGGRLAVCSGNIVRNLFHRGAPDSEDTQGLGISVEADAVVTGNVIERAPRAGLMLGWGEALRDVSASGNVIREAGIGVAVSVAPGAGSAFIADNLISQTRKGAIVGMRWTSAVTGDLAQTGADAFPNLRVERNHVS